MVIGELVDCYVEFECAKMGKCEWQGNTTIDGCTPCEADRSPCDVICDFKLRLKPQFRNKKVQIE